MLPSQILLTNLLSDFPAMAIGTDNVDQEHMMKPRRWKIKFIVQFMIVFGLVSSIFDIISFIILLYGLNATPEQFRTSWFFASVMTEIFILLVIRTDKLFFKSKPGKYLVIAIIIALIITIIVLIPPISLIFQFVLLPFLYIIIMVMIILFYTIAIIVTKYIFYRYIKF